MKQYIYIFMFFFTAFGIAQNAGSISGNLLDLEAENAPLLYAKVLVKETGTEVLSDEQGFFKFDNLKEGTYTLVYSFIGYETKTSEVQVEASKNEVLELYLGASTISLDDLASVYASADNNETAVVSNK
ncbi:carboxypeptidase-like regulatory domain-containing protein [Tamlana agarivorans]|uniref:Carboxypeptidase-like regulatory domain-containing protein n=1 Tax=Pseudotamlana agarivorans TaxID=481183 RepID=A0ACC5U6J6_9FLAO|nr:carboxypeptidase-like regulatory domain-containing protein [Tamlana agarivorans]MBU2949840.1 carboxypeptidase-like regulatory domain-containing protein [Tamlana agarivorans]